MNVSGNSIVGGGKIVYYSDIVVSIELQNTSVILENEKNTTTVTPQSRNTYKILHFYES